MTSLNPESTANCFLSIRQIDSNSRGIIAIYVRTAGWADDVPVVETMKVLRKAPSNDARGAWDQCQFVLRHGKQTSALPTVAMQMEGDSVGLWPSRKYISPSS